MPHILPHHEGVLEAVDLYRDLVQVLQAVQGRVRVRVRLRARARLSTGFDLRCGSVNLDVLRSGFRSEMCVCCLARGVPSHAHLGVS